MIRTPIKKTLLAVAVCICILISVRVPQLIISRTDMRECRSVATCYNAKQRSVVRTVLDDLYVTSRIALELGMIFLAIQVMHRAITYLKPRR